MEIMKRVFEIFIKVKVFLGYIPNYSNSKSLVCETASEHALTCIRETCSCSQTAVQYGATGYDLCIRIATLGNTIQTVNSPYMNKNLT